MRKMEVLFVGDSLIEWFDWAGRFPQHNVHNMGVSGETVQGLLRRLDRVLRRCPRPELVFIMSGINNVAMDETDFYGAYRDIIRTFRAKAPGARVFVTSLLPAFLPWLGQDQIVGVNSTYRGIAEQEGATYMDVYSRFVEAGPRDCLLEDGVHISPRGYELWSEEVEKAMALR